MKKKLLAKTVAVMILAASIPWQGVTLTTLAVTKADNPSNSESEEDTENVSKNAEEFEINVDGETTCLKKYTGNGGAVVIPEGVTEIGNSAFKGCSSLTSVIIPEGVTKVGNSAFAECTNLSSLTLPKSLKEFTFLSTIMDCEKLKSAGPIGSDCNIEFGWTESIPSGAFKRCNLTSVILPKGITRIDYGMFERCSNLTSVVIPEGVTSIASSAFDYCNNLSSITLPNSLKEFTFRSVFNDNSNNYKKLTSAGPIGSGCSIEFGWTEAIPNNVFEGYNSLTDVIIPDGVTDIGNSAFYKCNNLTNITIPESIRHIGFSAFAETAYYHNSENWENGLLYLGQWIIGANKDKIEGDYNIEEGTLGIADGGMTGCMKLSSVTLPKSLKYIGKDAFLTCMSLTKMSVYNQDTDFGERCYGFYDYQEVFHDGKGIESYPVELYGYEDSTAKKYADKSNAGKFNGKITFIPFGGSRPVPVESLHIEFADESKTTVGSTFQLIAVIEPDNATNKEVIWKSLDESIATVTASGLVTALKAGKAEIEATSADGKNISSVISFNIKEKEGSESGNSENTSGSGSSSESGNGSSSGSSSESGNGSSSGSSSESGNGSGSGSSSESGNTSGSGNSSGSGSSSGGGSSSSGSSGSGGGGSRSRGSSSSGRSVSSSSSGMVPVVAGTWIKDAIGWWLEGTDKSYPRNQWAQVNGGIYHFNDAGYMTEGWYAENGKWYYLIPGNGAMATGWIQLADTWYYLNANGAMAIGWMQDPNSGKWYYLGADGAMLVNTITPDNYVIGADGAWIQ